MARKGFLHRLFHEYKTHFKWDLFKEGLRLLAHYKATATILISSGVVSGIYPAIQRHNLSFGLIALIFTTSFLTLVSISSFVFLALLTAVRNRLESRTSELEAQSARARQEALELAARLTAFDSLKSRVWALLNRGLPVDVDFLANTLGKRFDQGAKEEILVVLSVLLNEGKIEGDRRNVGCYKLVDSPVRDPNKLEHMPANFPEAFLGRWEGWYRETDEKEWKPTAHEFRQNGSEIKAFAYGQRNESESFYVYVQRKGDSKIRLIWPYDSKTLLDSYGSIPNHIGTHIAEFRTTETGTKVMEGKYFNERERERDRIGAGGTFKCHWVADRPKDSLSFRENLWPFEKPPDAV